MARAREFRELEDGTRRKCATVEQRRAAAARFRALADKIDPDAQAADDAGEPDDTGEPDAAGE